VTSTDREVSAGCARAGGIDAGDDNRGANVVGSSTGDDDGVASTVGTNVGGERHCPYSQCACSG
jgi:hypothetical protein